MRWLARPRVLLALVAALVVVVVVWSFASAEVDGGVAGLRELGEQLREHAWFRFTVFVAVAAGQQVALPYVVLVALCVVFLGVFHGFLVIYTGTLVGATLGYLLGRYFGHDLLQRVSSPRVEELRKGVVRYGTRCMVIANLFPLVPHVVLNLVAGSSKMRFREFVAGTALGLLPSTLALVVVTELLLKYARIPTAGEALVVVLLAGIAGALLWWLGRRMWRRLEAD